MNTEKGTELLFTGTQKSGFEIIFSTRIKSACPSFWISGLCVTPAVSRVGVGIVYSRSKDAEIGLLGCNISIEAQCMIIKNTTGVALNKFILFVLRNKETKTDRNRI